MNRNLLPEHHARFLAEIDHGARSFPIARAIVGLCETGHILPELRDFNTALVGLLPGDRSPEALIVPPFAIFGRALSATTGSTGGALVQTDVAGPAVPSVRPLSAVLSAGARVISGLRGNLSLPSMSTGVGPLVWMAEGDPAGPLTEAFGQILASPKRAAGYLSVSRQLLRQSPDIIEAAIMTDLNSAIAQCIDLGGIAGLGHSAQPTGILNTAGIGSFTFGGAATIAPFANAEASLRTLGIAGPLTVLGSPASLAKWRVNPRSATFTTRALLEDDNRIAGMGVMTSGNLPDNRVLIGQFGAVQVLVWAVEIMSNPYSLALDGEVLIVVNLLCDVRVSRAAAFVASTDSGAQ